MTTLSHPMRNALRALLPNLPGIQPEEIASYPKYYKTKHIRPNTEQSLLDKGLIEVVGFLLCPSEIGLSLLDDSETSWVDRAALAVLRATTTFLD